MRCISDYLLRWSTFDGRLSCQEPEAFVEASDGTSQLQNQLEIWDGLRGRLLRTLVLPAHVAVHAWLPKRDALDIVGDGHLRVRTLTGEHFVDILTRARGAACDVALIDEHGKYDGPTGSIAGLRTSGDLRRAELDTGGDLPADVRRPGVLAELLAVSVGPIGTRSGR